MAFCPGVALTRNSSHNSTLFSVESQFGPATFTADHLFRLTSREFFKDDNRHEIAYSQLLEHLVSLFDKIIMSYGGSRHDCANFLRNMAPHLQSFNAVELQESFVEKLDALITFSCDMVRSASFFFLAHLISV